GPAGTAAAPVRRRPHRRRRRLADRLEHQDSAAHAGHHADLCLLDHRHHPAVQRADRGQEPDRERLVLVHAANGRGLRHLLRTRLELRGGDLRGPGRAVVRPVLHLLPTRSPTDVDMTNLTSPARGRPNLPREQTRGRTALPTKVLSYTFLT